MKSIGICAALVGVGLFGAVVVSAESGKYDGGDTSGEANGVTMAAEDIVATRRAGYFLSTQAVGQIKAGIEEGGDLRRTRAGAMMLANWAKAIPTLFPEGTDLESSRALSTVWSDRPGFEARAVAYREAALNLAETAATGDREASNSAFMAMAGTCHACHQTYREE